MFSHVVISAIIIHLLISIELFSKIILALSEAGEHLQFENLVGKEFLT